MESGWYSGWLGYGGEIRTLFIEGARGGGVPVSATCLFARLVPRYIGAGVATESEGDAKSKMVTTYLWCYPGILDLFCGQVTQPCRGAIAVDDSYRLQLELSASSSYSNALFSSPLRLTFVVTWFSFAKISFVKFKNNTNLVKFYWNVIFRKLYTQCYPI
jgi:hypothetical protein